MSTPSRPFQRIKPAGLASGSVEASWKDTIRNTEARFIGDVVPPANSAHAQFPLTGARSGRIPARTRRIGTGGTDRLHARHPDSCFRHAFVQRSAQALGDDYRSGEWQPVFSAAGYAGQIPVTLKGHASFTGTATGKLSQIAIAGNLQSQDFETLIPATSHTPEKIVNWNALQADIQLSPSVFAVRNGTLSRDPDSVRFDFHVQLNQRQFSDTSPVRAHLDTENADLPGILALAGYSYPITGTVDLHLQVAGTRAAPAGQGHVLLRNGSVYGEPVERFSSDLNFNGEEAELKNIQLTHYESQGHRRRHLQYLESRFSFQSCGRQF